MGKAEKIIDGQYIRYKADNPHSVYCIAERSDYGNSGLHSHSVGQLLYLSEGITHLTIPNQQAVISPSRAAWIPPHLEHATIMNKSHHYQSLYIDTKTHSNLPAHFCIKQISPLLRQLVLDVERWPEPWEESSIYGLKAQVIAHEIACASEVPLQVPSPSDRRLATICAQLMQQPEVKHTLKEWGAIVGASDKTLSRLFQSELGVSFHHWRLHVRMMHAISLLDAQASNTDVALAVGYCSDSALIHAFSNYFGYSPGDYQRSKTK